MGVRVAKTEHDIDELLGVLESPTRREPVCVLTTNARGEHAFDPAEIASDTSGICHVWALETGHLTYMLTDRLNAGVSEGDLRVFGGAARTFPAGTGWKANPASALRRFPGSDTRRHKTQVEHVIADIHAMAYQAGLLSMRVSEQLPTRATVRAFMAEGSRAMVKLSDGTPATIAQELTVKEVPLDELLHVGQEVDGKFDAELKRFLIEIPAMTNAQIFAAFPPSTVTLGLVRHVDRRLAEITLFPGFHVQMPKSLISSNPYDLPNSFMEVGDVVPVRVGRSPQGRLSVSMLDIDDDEPIVDALPVVPGGKPWLTEAHSSYFVDTPPEVEPIESFLARFGLSRLDEELDARAQASSVELDSAPSEDVAPPAGSRSIMVPGPGPRPAVAMSTASPELTPAAPASTTMQSMQLTIDTLRAQLKMQEIAFAAEKARALDAQGREWVESLREVVSQRDGVLSQQDSAKTQLKKLRKENAELKRKRVAGLDFDVNRGRFASTPDGERDWINFELQLAWVERVPYNERAGRAAPVAIVGDRFVESFVAMESGKKAKALRAMLDVLSGDRAKLAALEVHPLREGDGAAARDLVREDGAKCKRAYVEEKSPAARRLHYWQLPDNSIEFSRVVVHDDMEP
jgi:hypothetical protein